MAVNAGRAATTSATVVLATWLRASVALMVTLKVPAAVGVPLISPVEGLSVRPGGRLPALTAQVYGPVPPVSVGCWL